MEPEKNLARALRRHHTARLKHVRQQYWGYDLFEMSPRQQGIVVTTPHPCSGLCCGNARKWLGERTVQERRALQHSVEELLNDQA